jgi:diguanylate cyclase (GGDEF)-like protein/PAS domain S-box-containing protein
MSKSLRVLIVEDNPEDLQLLLQVLERNDYAPTYERVETAAAMRAALERDTWDLVLSDYSLPYFSAPAALALLKDSKLDIPFIIVSGTLGDDVMAAAISVGAHDFVRHESMARLVPAIERERRAALTRLAWREAESKYQTLVEQIPAGIHIINLDADGSTRSISPQLERILGFSLDQWLADPQLWRKQLHPDDRDRVVAELAHIYTPGAQPFIAEYRMLAWDGREVWLRDETVIVRDEADQPKYLQSVKLEITARKRAEVEVQELNAKLNEWVRELEQHNREITLLNEMGNQLQVCLTTEEAYGIIGDFAQLLFPAESGALYVFNAPRTNLEAVTAWGQHPPKEQVFAPDECWGLRRGRLHVVEDFRSGQVCQHVHEAGPVTGYLCMPMMAQGEALGVLHLQRLRSEGAEAERAPRDSLSESKQRLAATVAEHLALALANLKLRETLRIQSSRDALTGLFNRRYLDETLERELRRAARKGRTLGVILFALEQWDGISEEMIPALETSETLLRDFGNFLQTQIRGEDFAGRYEHNQFIFLIPEASSDVTQQRAEQLRAEFKLPQTPGALALLPAGVAAFPEHGTSVEALLRTAESALYRSRPAERDRAAAELAAAPPLASQYIEITEQRPGNGTGQARGTGPLSAEAGAKPDEAPIYVVAGGLVLNTQTFELTIGEKTVRPTPVEYELLSFLMRNTGKVFTAEQLLQEVWHYPPGTGSHELVRAHIKNLRSKIEPNPRQPIYLKTVGRFGYTIVSEETPQNA